MDYKVDDEVTIHSKKWFKRNCTIDKDGDYVYKGNQDVLFTTCFVRRTPMVNYCEKKAKIIKIAENNTYQLNIDSGYYEWRDWMFKKPRYTVEEKKSQIAAMIKDVEDIQARNNQIYVYIASPYTKGDTAQNVYESFKFYNNLVDLGFYPFSPLTSHFIHMMFPQDYDKWMDIDFKWLEKCDCVLRLSGESKGADMEVEKAKKLNKPVFYNVNDLMKHYYTEVKFNGRA